jgi:hypothetical protein
MKKFIVLFFISTLVFAVGNASRTIYTENVATKASNQTITVTPTGTGYVNLNTNTALKVPVGTEAQRPTPAQGMLRYNTDGGRFEGYNGTDWAQIAGSGGSGGVNYLEDNSDLETNDTGYVEYADAAATSPVDGTGGSANVVFSRNTSSPLRGTADGRLLVDAANRQGEGFAYDFTIAKADQAQKLLISFEYDASDSDYVDGDLKVFVYDVTNSVLIRVSGEDIKAGSGKHFAQFQTSPNSTSYRLIFHVSSTNANGYSVYFDNFSVGPSKLSFGLAGYDNVTFTPTGSWSTNTTYTGSYSRVGQHVIINYKIALAGAPTAANLNLNLPTGLTVDETALLESDTRANVTLNGDVYDNGSDRYDVIAAYSFTNNRFDIRVKSRPTTYIEQDTDVSNTVPITFASGDVITLSVRVPISGWTSNTRLSEDLGERKVFTYIDITGGTQGTSGSSAKLSGTYTALYDYTASYSSANSQIIVPKTGIYRVFSTVGYDGNVTGVRQAGVYNVTTSSFASVSNNDPLSSAAADIIMNSSNVIFLTKGNVLELWGLQNSGSSLTLVTVDGQGQWGIESIDSPQTLLETETVAARYNSNSGQAVTTSTTIVYEDRISDTHNAYNTSTGVYTVPVSGFYAINASFALDTESWVAGTSITSDIEVNGTVVKSLFLRVQASVSTTMSLNASDSIYLNKGDQVEIVSTSPISTNTLSTNNLNVFSIARIK